MLRSRAAVVSFGASSWLASMFVWAPNNPMKNKIKNGSNTESFFLLAYDFTIKALERVIWKWVCQRQKKSSSLEMQKVGLKKR
jgi:hypothetical protein